MAIDGFHSRETSAIPAVPASTLYEGEVEFENPAGEKVKLDGAGIKQFEAETPEGKKWTVSAKFNIIETDA